jgi:hypothetical protein
VDNDAFRSATAQKPEHFHENRAASFRCRFSFLQPTRNLDFMLVSVTANGLPLFLKRDPVNALFGRRDANVSNVSNHFVHFEEVPKSGWVQDTVLAEFGGAPSTGILWRCKSSNTSFRYASRLNSASASSSAESEGYRSRIVGMWFSSINQA